MALTQLSSALTVETQDDDYTTLNVDDMTEERCDEEKPECLMFGPDGWDDHDEAGITYFAGFTSGREYGQRDCDDGKHYHNYGPPDECAPGGQDPSCETFADGVQSAEGIGALYKEAFLEGYEDGWEISCTIEEIDPHSEEDDTEVIEAIYVTEDPNLYTNLPDDIDLDAIDQEVATELEHKRQENGLSQVS